MDVRLKENVDMTVTNKVVVFSLLGLSVVAADYVVAHKEAQPLLNCQQALDNDSFFTLSHLSSSKAMSNTFQATNLHTDIAKTKSQQLADYSQCLIREDNSVSWSDWFFSWQDSPTFHYLDLLELLTPVDNSDNGGSHPVKH